MWLFTNLDSWLGLIQIFLKMLTYHLTGGCVVSLCATTFCHTAPMTCWLLAHARRLLRPSLLRSATWLFEQEVWSKWVGVATVTKIALREITFIFFCVLLEVSPQKLPRVSYFSPWSLSCRSVAVMFLKVVFFSVVLALISAAVTTEYAGNFVRLFAAQLAAKIKHLPGCRRSVLYPPVVLPVTPSLSTVRFSTSQRIYSKLFVFC